MVGGTGWLSSNQEVGEEAYSLSFLPVRQFRLGLGIRTKQVDSLGYQEPEAGQHD